MNIRKRVSIDGIIPPPVKVSRKSIRVFHTGLRKLGDILHLEAHGARIVFASFVSLSLVAGSTLLISGFEAHVLNVTATIERRPCEEFKIRSLGFWKNHPGLWILPQNLGAMTVSSSGEVVNVFNASNALAVNKLKKQLLALKFNVASSPDLIDALVPGETTTIGELILEADALLSQTPQASSAELEAMFLRVEATNTAGKVSTCVPPCPTDMTMLKDISYVINSSTTFSELSGNVNPGDHVKVDFTLVAGCENMQFSLASYKVLSPNELLLSDSDTGFFDSGHNALEVDVPACLFKIHFVKGPVIEHLTSTDNYVIQERLIARDSGDPGAPACTTDELPPLQASVLSSFVESSDTTSSTPEASSVETSSSADVVLPPDSAPSPSSSIENSEVSSENTAPVEPVQPSPPTADTFSDENTLPPEPLLENTEPPPPPAEEPPPPPESETPSTQ